MSVTDSVGSVQALPESLVLAVDTEFVDTHTLTVQVAARLSPDIVVTQVYRSAAIPEPPPGFQVQHYLPTTPDRYGRFFQQIIERPIKLLTPDISPMRMVQDLLDQPQLRLYSRADGEQMLQAFEDEPTSFWSFPQDNVSWNQRRKRWDIPPLHLTIVGHFLRADFGRLFGWQFVDKLKKFHVPGRPRIAIDGRKLLGFVEQHGRRRNTKPILEYFYQGRDFYEVHVEMRDTMLTFGTATLDRLCKTFLGISKCSVFGEKEKQDMFRTFADRTADAYGYANTDVVNTLLVYEQMTEKDREIYRAFQFAEADIPPLQPFLGGRVSTFLIAATRASVAKGSQNLQTKTSLRSLMRGGGKALFHDQPEVSKFGEQAGQIHGGLLFSRSPTHLWHEARGMLGDVDMSSCYVENASRINVYWGRPVVLEPGGQNMTVAEAVSFVRKLAPDDGWILFASGPISGYHNALIPSTEAAITGINYGNKQRSKRRQGARQAFLWEAERDPDAVKATKGAKLYTAQVDFGVVSNSTWLMIQAMPTKVRKQYEHLAVDSILFYPKRLIAENGTDYDELTHKYAHDSLSWESVFNEATMELVHRQKIDAEYVSLRFPLAEYCRKFAEFRKLAQETEGKNSGQDLAWKQHGNTIYGVLASPFHVVNNTVAANIITSMARARAFALSQALNAIQTITDGCTYRRDQIPAIPYAECLRRQRDYPIHRVEMIDKIAFQDTATIPTDPDAFTAWYTDHAKRFFGVAGPEYDAFFSSHRLVHKQTEKTNSVLFDALACDGAGNYIKATLTEGGQYQVEEFKARSYGQTSKAVLPDWLLEVFRTDNLTELPPLTEDSDLLSLMRACSEARALLDAGVTPVYLPLGLQKAKVMNYRIIKASAFLFQTPKQRLAIVNQMRKFEEKHGCGLEVLALRRGYRGRRQGSLGDLLTVIETAIRQGKNNLTSTLNLGKKTDCVQAQSLQRLVEIENSKARVQKDLRQRIDVTQWNWVLHPTALLVNNDDLLKHKQDGQVLLSQSATFATTGQE